jgi:hypothetical protein
MIIGRLETIKKPAAAGFGKVPVDDNYRIRTSFRDCVKVPDRIE